MISDSRCVLQFPLQTAPPLNRYVLWSAPVFLVQFHAPPTGDSQVSFEALYQYFVALFEAGLVQCATSQPASAQEVSAQATVSSASTAGTQAMIWTADDAKTLFSTALLCMAEVRSTIHLR
jgi:hypothetical protein